MSLFSILVAIGISNPGGPCSECMNYFFQQLGYFNLFW